MIDTASLLSDYVGLDKYSDSEIITPMNIVSDMVDLLPAEIFSPDAIDTFQTLAPLTTFLPMKSYIRSIT